MASKAVEKVLAIARKEIGYHEKVSSSGLDDPLANAGGGNYTKYARDLDRIPGFYNGPKQGYAWCDVFYDWLLVAAFGPILAKRLLCQPDNSAGAGCYYSALYFREAGRFYPYNPEPGDQVFFTFQSGEVSHTGIVEDVHNGSVVTIEGNSSDSVVRRSYFTISDQIYGYGRPDWSMVPAAMLGDAEDDAEPADTDEPDPVSESDTAPVETYDLTLPVLREGDQGVLVERIQTLLIARGYYCGGRLFSGRERPDGEFGPATAVAVRDLQKSVDLDETGTVDCATMTALLTE